MARRTRGDRIHARKYGSRSRPSARSPRRTRQGVVMRIGGAAVNRTQRLVLGFVALVWLALAVILLVSPETYDGSVGPTGIRRRLVDVGILVALSVPLALLGLATVRRWRWAFWLRPGALFARPRPVPAGALPRPPDLP